MVEAHTQTTSSHTRASTYRFVPLHTQLCILHERPGVVLLALDDGGERGNPGVFLPRRSNQAPCNPSEHIRCRETARSGGGIWLTKCLESNCQLRCRIPNPARVKQALRQ